MSRMRTRLLVLHVLVLSLLAVLAVRLWQVQVVRGAEFVATATQTRTRTVIVPAIRGQILDSTGRPLVRNQSGLVVSIDRNALERLPDRGDAVLARLAGVLKVDVTTLRQRIRPCGPGIKRPCWPGSGYQPIPVDTKVTNKEALQILERQEDFPAVTAEVQAVRSYPGGRNGAQMLGYLQPVTEHELERREGLKADYSGVDLVGRDGLESVYDQYLRGTPGVRRVQVDRMGKPIGLEHQSAPVTGATLITSIDARVQDIVEKALAKAMKNAPQADGAAGVVLDVKTGRVIAIASLPGYDPAVWTGGISEREYQRLLSDKEGRPLTSRAISGTFAPGSTFKVSSVSAMVTDGYPLNGTYDCPGAFMVGGRAFHNFRGIGLGPMNLHTALVRSCDTIFYRAAFEMWLRDGGNKPVAKPKDPMANTSRAFGFGKATGIDLPGEAPGRIPDRVWKKELWAATRATNCARSKRGYPEVKDGARAAFLKRLAYENCLEGFKWRGGDAANFSIGQGDVLVTPLQLANAYAALVGDGKVRSPRIGWRVVQPDGTVIKEITPPVIGKLPIDKATRDYIKNALSQVASDGTAAGAFNGFPMDAIRVGGKTGTAEVYGKADTSWFASFAPTDKPRFVVVAMVSQGGMGGSAAAPAVREIYEGMFGFGEHKTPVLLEPAAHPPVIKPDGTVSQ